MKSIIKSMFLLIIFVLFITGNVSGGQRRDDSDGTIDDRFVDYTDYKDRMPTDLYRGINVGNALDAPNEGEWGWTLKEEYFEIIKNAGFDHVRVPIRWSNHALKTPPYTITQSFFDRVDWAINNILSRGMTAVINMHHYNELFQTPVAHKERFLEMWSQISTHYKDYSDKLYFEVLNEPNTNLSPALWNQYLAEVYNIIRQTNTDRYIIIDTALWGNYNGLQSLKIPVNDSKIIVSIHLYVPWEFCFQGVTFIEPPPPTGIKWRGTTSEKKLIYDVLNNIVQWSKDHNNVPIWNGEYCVHHWADMKSRVYWTRFVTREAEKRGIANTIWSFHKSDSAGLYDPDSGKWKELLLNAVIPISSVFK